MLSCKCLAVSLLAFTLGGNSPAENLSTRPVVIRFGHLIDASGSARPGAIVVVKDDRIVSVGPPDLATPADAELIDLSRFTYIPGLIDVHTHMTYFWDRAPGTRPWQQLEERMPAVNVFLAQENAHKTLETGVTSVRDLGSYLYQDIAMRDLINRGAMLGPRMFVSGHGLHVTRQPLRPGFCEPDPGKADGVPEVLRTAREQLGAGADVIKVYGSTGGGQDVSGHQTYTFDEMKAAVDAAHKAGKKIAMHSYGPDGARDAVRAGTDSLEHGTDIDDETLAEMARRQTFYVPTIDHNRYYAEHREEFGYGPEVAKRLGDYLDRNLETARRAHKAGVRFAMGSDAVFTMFGENTRELRWFVQAGMTPKEALATATTNGAALLGMEDRLGKIAPGYYADLVAIEGDPLADINVVIDRVRWVIKGGRVVLDRTGQGRR
jgi:imidazolonepropionase-like amidohydrolase